MKYYSISFEGEFGQHVEEIWSEDQIIKSYYKYWSGKMVENVPNCEVCRERCIDDWCTVHWAIEVPKPDWIEE